jgi:quinol monooxygenase YgiN
MRPARPEGSPAVFLPAGRPSPDGRTAPHDVHPATTFRSLSNFLHDIDISIVGEPRLASRRYKFASIAIENQPMETDMERSTTARHRPRSTEMFSRRSVIRAFGAVLAIYLSPWTVSSSQSQEQGDRTMNHYATKKSISDAVDGGGLLIVAQWEAKPGEADKVAAILDSFLPEAQREEGAKLFLISRAKDNPSQFLFYELFRDEAAFKAHQESAHFKTYIAGQALPLLAKRERMQYALL